MVTCLSSYVARNINPLLSDPFQVWNFKTRKLISSWPVGSPLVRMTFHRGNGLIAVASDDLTIRVYDAAAHRLVRKFPGHADRITGMCFSEDGR